jgi:hypothetical protein
MSDRQELRKAMNEVAREKLRRGLTEEAAFAGNREQRRKAKRAYDRLTKGSRTPRNLT